MEPKLDHEQQARIEADYRALREGAGVRLCRERIVVRMSGDDRASFLHGMCSNDIAGLKPGDVTPVLFLTEHAHLIADANVWCRTDALLLELERNLWPAVRAHLERFLVADDVEFEEDAGAVRLGDVIQIDGPRASSALAAAFGDKAPLCGAGRFATAEDDSLLVAQVTRFGRPAFTILAPRQDARAIVARLAAAGGSSADLREVTAAAAEIVRVESGTARSGVDTNERTIALEARLQSAISFNKGCYIGQETVERATARGALKRRLMGLRIAAAEVPAAGARVMLGGKEVGRITSPLRSPRQGAIALAILHHSAWEPGTAVTVENADGGESAAAVSELPFA